MKIKLPRKSAPPPRNVQCSKITLRGDRCTFPAVDKGMCRLHAYLARRK